MEESFEDQQFVEFVVKSIVDNPDKVTTERIIDEMGVLITLDVDPADMGQVIGRNGQTAKSIRTLLKVVGAKNNARVNMKINEPEGGKRAPRKEETPAPAEAPSIEEMGDPTGSVAEDLDL
ncbi:MAG: KH domain-containing protein [Candidatus Doudnabacteria bacterium]|nr:KH domain-containing protein [Candidatus Doudnabacteria bacterium]MCA9387520.1 KH domain-containing protein [Candidatus Andersenbacteria bacterium]